MSSLLTELVGELIQAEIIGALEIVRSLMMLENKRCNALCSYEYGVLKDYPLLRRNSLDLNLLESKRGPM